VRVRPRTTIGTYGAVYVRRIGDPAFEHFTLGEITTGRGEWVLKSRCFSPK
jgi:hypothetical protein